MNLKVKSFTRRDAQGKLNDFDFLVNFVVDNPSERHARIGHVL